MSLEFSGHTTRSGCWARPAATSAASARVALTWLSSTARRWALNSSPSRGTLPWTIGDPDRRPAGAGRPGPTSGTATAATATRAATGRDRRRPPRRRRSDRGQRVAAASDGQREQAADRADAERDQRGAAERGQPQQRRVALAEREPPPREAAERGPVAQRLLQHPQRAGDQRPASTASGRPPGWPGRDEAAEQREVDRLADRQEQPDRARRSRRPSSAAGSAGTGRSTRPSPAPAQKPRRWAARASSGDPDRGQEPQVVRREGEQQEQAGEPTASRAPDHGRTSAGVGRPGAGRRSAGPRSGPLRRVGCGDRVVDHAAIVPDRGCRTGASACPASCLSRGSSRRVGLSAETGSGRGSRRAPPPRPLLAGGRCALAAFGPARGELAAHHESLSTGRACPPAREPAPPSCRSTPRRLPNLRRSPAPTTGPGRAEGSCEGHGSAANGQWTLHEGARKPPTERTH